MAIEMSLEERIGAPPERVFAALVDLDSWPLWIPGLVRIERLTDGPFDVGTRWREVRRLFGREAAEVFEVTGIDRDRRLDLYVDGSLGSSRRGEYRFSHLVTPHESGTLLALEGEIVGLGRFMELIGVFFVGNMKRAIAKDLRGLKAFVEAERRR